jgi:hypothetical protein
MIYCPVCSQANDEFATVCTHCHGFLQNRVPHLDLFDTVWGIIENPRKTFRTIMLAEHKTYAFTLSAFFGIGCSFASLLFFRAGDRFDSLLQLIVFCILSGAVFGCGLAPILSMLHYGIIKTMGGKGHFKNSLAVSAYAFVPIILSIVFILPIELSTFGMYLFTFNPSPQALNPVSYFLLFGIDAFCVLWSAILFILGTKISFGITYVRSLAGSAIAAVLMLFLCEWGISALLRRIF